jgi:hypothetical protein
MVGIFSNFEVVERQVDFWRSPTTQVSKTNTDTCMLFFPQSIIILCIKCARLQLT